MKIGEQVIVKAGVYKGKQGQIVDISVDEKYGTKNYKVVVPPDTRSWWFTNVEVEHILSRKVIRKELKQIAKEVIGYSRIDGERLMELVEKI